MIVLGGEGFREVGGAIAFVARGYFIQVVAVSQLTRHGNGRTKAASAEFKITCRRCILPLACWSVGQDVLEGYL